MTSTALTRTCWSDTCFRDAHLPELPDEMQACLAGEFDVEHSTLQFERAVHADHENATHA